MTPEQFSQLKVGDLVKHNLTDKPLIVQEVNTDHGTVMAVLPVTISKASCAVWQQGDMVEVPKDATLPV